VVSLAGMSASPIKRSPERQDGYLLEDQIGFILRQAQQRHTGIFASLMSEELTPTQWAAVAKLGECGRCSQNQLGRLTAMDAATIKGVIDRLARRGFTTTTPDEVDGRRHYVALTAKGRAIYAKARPIAERITRETLAPLNEGEHATLIGLLRRLI
jgi:MarR family transcriptional regulator, lower aerobic nicotinate degradation pathway regulator